MSRRVRSGANTLRVVSQQSRTMDDSNSSEQLTEESPKPPAQGWKKSLRAPLMMIGPVAVAIAAAYVYVTGGRYEATDDAYVQTARVAISANVAGRVVELAVHDNQAVLRGDVLFRLDDAPYRIPVNRKSTRLNSSH